MFNLKFFNYFIFNWRIFALQYCIDFCHTTTWISHRYAYVSSLLNLPPSPTLYYSNFKNSYSSFIYYLLILYSVCSYLILFHFIWLSYLFFSFLEFSLHIPQCLSIIYLNVSYRNCIYIWYSGLKLRKVGKTTRPFKYDLNQIPYDCTLEVTNRLKGLDLIEWPKIYG